MSDKPFSPACERNREPIAALLSDHLGPRGRLLEIGSGTGQHAAALAGRWPDWCWQTSERDQHGLAGIRAWLDDARQPNTPPPLQFDVNDPAPPAGRWDAVYTANTLHIMSWAEVVRLFAQLPVLLADDGLLLVYGPFAYGGVHTSPSNAEFDHWLRANAPHQGVRDFNAVEKLAEEAGLRLVEDRPMPANNRGLVWRRARD